MTIRQNTTPLSYLFFCMLFILTACSQNPPKDTPENTHAESTSTTEKKEAAHWSYAGESGPENWAAIEKKSDCGGQAQSPINIIEKDAVSSTTKEKLFDFHYAEQTLIHDVINNGHSIQYNFEHGDHIDYKGDEFDLKQFHFHEPSEHTINGIRYPLEIHLVHQNAAKEYLVLSFMAIEGETSPTFSFLESYLPIKVGETKAIKATFDFNEILAGKESCFHYTGSLTTPPCTEGVKWFIFKEPITVSEEQVKELQILMPLNNYRTTQAMNGRTVEVM